MSDETLKAILSKLETMDKKLDSQGEVVTQLVKMVGNANSKLNDTNTTLHAFRSETGLALKKLDRRVKLIESDLDETMVKVDELNGPRN